MWRGCVYSYGSRIRFSTKINTKNYSEFVCWWYKTLNSCHYNHHHHHHHHHDCICHFHALRMPNMCGRCVWCVHKVNHWYPFIIAGSDARSMYQTSKYLFTIMFMCLAKEELVSIYWIACECDGNKHDFLVSNVCIDLIRYEDASSTMIWQKWYYG